MNVQQSLKGPGPHPKFPAHDARLYRHSLGLQVPSQSSQVEVGSKYVGLPTSGKFHRLHMLRTALNPF